MANEKINKFIENYPLISKYEKYERPITKKFSEQLEKIKNKIINEYPKLVKENEGNSKNKAPCLFKTLSINGWHSENDSCYIFINILTKKIGIVMNGYEDESQKKIFKQFWNEKYTKKIENDKNVYSLTYIDEDNDGIEAYFKVEGSKGKPLDPFDIRVFRKYFYWGYVHELETEKLNSYPETIEKDFNKLFNNYIKNNELKIKSKTATSATRRKLKC